MASEKDLELLDDYIGNRLKPQDRTAFERQLEADPALKGEWQIQQRIAEGIRQARTAELKTMLQNIPVSGLQGGQASLGTKIGLWVAGAALVGAGVYFYMNRDTVEPSSTGQEIAVVPDEEQIEEKPPVVNDMPTDEPAAETETSTPAAPEEQKQNIPAVPPVKADDSVEAITERPAIDAFDPTDDAQDDKALEENTTTGAAKTTKDRLPVSIDKNNKKYSFHYQIRDGQIFLYGPFEKGLYEIMEFFSENKRTIFLFHQNNYYLLNDETEKVRPLAPITDPVLIKKLKEYRAN